MDIISAYCEAGTYQGAAAISGTTPKAVRRVIARHEASGGRASPREHNYDVLAGLVAERVRKTRAGFRRSGCCRRRGQRGMRGRRGISAGWSRRPSRHGGGIITAAAVRRCGRRVSTW